MNKLNNQTPNTRKSIVLDSILFTGLIARIVIFSILFTILVSLTATVSAQSGTIDWNGWNFSYQAGADRSGLVLTDVAFNNKKILDKASMPVMRVEYDRDVCGPYADILSSSTFEPARSGAPDSACNNKTLCERTFTQDGQEKLELGLNIQIGEYQIYQSYYFSPDGTMDTRVFSRGLQCRIDHSHHPHWLLDFDIGDSANDQIYKNDNELQSVEFNDRKGSSQFWTVKDRVTGDSVTITPSAEDGVFDNFSQWDVAGRRYQSGETGRWLYGARGEIGNLFNNNQNIDGQDIVFWYVSHLRHLASEGPTLWHASGPTLKVNNGASPPPPPPANTPPTVSFASPANNSTFTTGDSIGVVVNASDADGSVSNVRLFINNQLVRQENSLPYEWGTANTAATDSLLSNLAAGTYTLRALARDNANLETAATINIVVSDAPPPPPPPSSTNLLSNPNFDSNINGWNNCGGSTSTATVTGGELRLNNGGCVYQELSATVGQAYKLSCDAKRSGSSWTSVYLAFSNANFATLASDITPVTTSGFSNYSASLTAPAQSVYTVAVLYSETPASFDNCVLVEDDGTVTGPPTNLIRNAGFESDLDGWFNCGNPSNVTISSDANSGTKSARVQNGGCLYQEARAEPGASYTLSCKAKRSAQDYTSLSFSFSDAAYQALANENKVISTNTYGDYSMTLTAPANTQNAVVVFYGEGDSNFDDCSLVKN